MIDQLTTTSILSLFETNKEERRSFVDDIMMKLESGYTDPLSVHLQIKAMEDIINQLTNTDEKKNKNAEVAKRYKALLLDAASKYGKSFTFHNAEFKEKEVGSKFDYSKCNDLELIELENQFNELKERLDERRKFLQGIPEKGLDHLTPEGEKITLYRPSKTSTTAITVTLK